LLFICLTASSHHVLTPLFRPCEAGVSADCTDSLRRVWEMVAQSHHIAASLQRWAHCACALSLASSLLQNFHFHLHSSTFIYLCNYLFITFSILYILLYRFIKDSSFLPSDHFSFLRPFPCWNCVFESRRGHRRLSLLSVVCCQVDVSASD
jgi:hypothetical protein